MCPTGTGLVPCASIKRNFHADTFISANGSIFCSNPYRIADANKARKHNDHAWMTQLGCIVLNGGQTVIKLSPDTLTWKEGKPWKVHIITKAGKEATAYTDPSSLTWPDGYTILPAIRDCMGRSVTCRN